MGWEGIIIEGLKDNETSGEGIKSEALNRMGGGRANTATLGSGDLELQWATSTKSSSSSSSSLISGRRCYLIIYIKQCL